MLIRLNQLCGFDRVPRCKKNAANWVQREGIQVVVAKSDGGPCNHVHLSDLPNDVRMAYLTRQIEQSGLDVGEYDEAAHDAFRALPASA